MSGIEFQVKFCCTVGMKILRQGRAGVPVIGFLACVLALAAWQPQSAEAAEAVTIAKTETGLRLEARSAALDEVLAALGETLGFTVEAHCAPEGCPRLSGDRVGSQMTRTYQSFTCVTQYDHATKSTGIGMNGM